ncbi:MAG: LacI family transcriptional regulator [Actinobacteria bacterium]|nr:LacI family transcriptional regulator [Actinomycetota bacterium]
MRGDAASNPTMKDVAKLAEVSIKTVSRFVNGETNIDPALTARIDRAIRVLGYRRNLAAASIRPGWTSRMLGLIISDLANPYYSTLARAIEEVVSAEGYMLIVSSSEESGEHHDEILDRLMEQRVDGLIIVPPRRPGRPWSEVRPPIPPLVFLDRPAGYFEADVVLADNAGGSAAATRALYHAGARSIAFLGDSLQIYTIRERYRGYCAALEEVGLSADSQPLAIDAHSRQDAEEKVLELLDSGEADSIFAANNRAAIGALQAFRARGGSVPLIGFDDFEVAHLIGPGLSTVSQDIDRMGRDAARMLLRRLTGHHDPYQTVLLPTQLVLRGSEYPGWLDAPNHPAGVAPIAGLPG